MIIINFLVSSQHNSSAQMSPTSPKTSQYGSEHDGSSVSSRTSSPDPNQRRDSNGSSMQSTPQMNFLQKQREMRERESQVNDNIWIWTQELLFILCNLQSRNPEPPPHSPTGGFYDKPPIPPRGVPPPVPQRQSSVEKVSDVQMRPKNMNGNGELKFIITTKFKSETTFLCFPEDHYSNTPSNRPYSLQQPQSRAPLVGQNGSNGNGNGNGTEEVWLRQGEGRSSGELWNDWNLCKLFFWFCLLWTFYK